jgi:hypothetical protein
VTALPLIVGFGGINAAGRSSDHQAFRRLILNSLSTEERARTVDQLGVITGLGPAASTDPVLSQRVLDQTLIRQIQPDWFDADAVSLNRLAHTKTQTSVWLSPLQIPTPLPPGWRKGQEAGRLTEFLVDPCDLMIPGTRRSTVQAAGMAPTGFRPDQFYPSRNHPRTLQLRFCSA